jgi:hypothetical protein
MKKVYLFPLVWSAVFCAWYFISGNLLERDKELFLTLRDRGEHVAAVVVDRTETRRSPGKSDERMEYALRLQINVSSGQSADARLGVDKGRYDAQPLQSTIAVVAAPTEPSRYMLQEDFERHGPDGSRTDAGSFRWLGGAVVSTLLAGLVVAFWGKSQKA